MGELQSKSSAIFRSAMLLFLLSLFGANMAGATAAPPPPRHIFLFWAIWCAPCRAEIAEIDALTAAARPLSVVVVPVERRSRWQDGLAGVDPSRIWQPPGDPFALMLNWGGGASLPFAVATDRRGQRCATAQTRVSTALLREWAARCG